MNMFGNYEFIIGIAVGKILCGSVLASPLLRNLALGAAALGICLLYSQHGVNSIIESALFLRGDVLARPEFSKGALVGSVLAIIVFGVWQQRKA
jgi:hypothetical protein